MWRKSFWQLTCLSFSAADKYTPLSFFSSKWQQRDTGHTLNPCWRSGSHFKCWPSTCLLLPWWLLWCYASGCIAFLCRTVQRSQDNSPLPLFVFNILKYFWEKNKKQKKKKKKKHLKVHYPFYNLAFWVSQSPDLGSPCEGKYYTELKVCREDVTNGQSG